MILRGFSRFCSFVIAFKTAKFPFQPMDYNTMVIKNSINRNWPKNFMQVGIDVACMHTNFGGRDFSGFGDKISL